MIAFGCAVGDPESYRRYAEPGIRLASEPDSKVFPFAAVGTVGRSYNVLLDAAAGDEDLEALVIVHPHTELADPDLCQKVRLALSDPEIGVVGCTGATDVRTIAWWEGAVSRGAVTHRYTEYGGGDLPGVSWTAAGPAPAEVETLDGTLLVISPWTARNVRFDEGLMLHHGFDLDFCLQVRSAGRRLMTADIRVIEHRPLEIIEDLGLWVEAHIRLAQKWDGRMPGAEQREHDWKRRARRAEAEREAARAIAYSKRLAMDARIQELELVLQQATDTVSWRLTEPLRQLNKWRRSTAGRLDRGSRTRSKPAV